MKTRIKYAAVSLFAAMLLTGCLDLDQRPTDRYLDETFWRDLERAQGVLYMAYNQMYSFAHTWEDECVSDNMMATYSNDNVATIRRGNATPSTPHFENRWKWLFEGIRTCNTFLEGIEFTQGVEPGQKDRMIAEIRFIRAYLYFRGVIFWGDMPHIFRVLTVAETANTPRIPKADMMAILHQEINEIIDLLPTRQQLPAAENGRITQGAAAMLKIRFYLMENNMPKVEEWCRDFMDGEYGDYDLFTGSSPNYSSYESLFHSAHEYNCEVILDYAAVITNKEWNTIGMAPQTLTGRVLTSRTPTQSLVDDYITLNGLPVKGAVTFPEPYNSDPSYNEANPYVNRDPRLDATVVYDKFVWKDKDAAGNLIQQTIYIWPGTIPNSATAFVGRPDENQYPGPAATKTGYYLRKLYDPDNRGEQRMNNNRILMRYADVLLMYAEACQANGTFNETVWNETIRPIRVRAGFTSIGALDYPSGLDADNYRELIRRERRCELALEGLRYFDLIRWNLGTTLLNRTMYGARMGGVSNNEYVEVDTWQFRANRDGLWSLPFLEMNRAPAIRPNNPNY